MADIPYIQQAQEIKITGQDNTGTTVNYVSADANGNLFTKDYSDGATGSAVPTVSSQVAGSDGTNLRTLSTDTSGRLKTLLFDASGNALTSTTVGAKQTLDVNSTFVDTAPATINITAQDVVSTTSIGYDSQSIITGTPTANSSASFALSYKQSVVVQITGTWTGTLQSEGSIDSGTTWYIVPLILVGTSFQSGIFTANIGATGAVAGLTNYRIRSTAAWTGTATIRVIETQNNSASYPVNPIGQQVKANSIPVVLPSDQTITVTDSPLPATGSKFSFGGVTTATTSQTAVNATTYTEVTTNAAMTIVSSSTNDTSAGTGARTVTVTYYDQNMTGPQTVTITMNGTTVVTSPNNNMAYIEKIVVATVGSGGSNAGTLTLKSGATTVATIPTGQNLTAFAHHYVPQGKTCYISGFSVGGNGSSAGQSGTFVLKASTPTVANTPELQISDFLLVTGAGNSVVRNYNSPIQVSGPARIQAYVTPGATSSYTNYASFDFIDN